MKELDVALLTKLNAIPSLASLAPGGVWNTWRQQGDASWPVIVFRAVTRPDEDHTYGTDGGETHTYDVQAFAPIDDRGLHSTLPDVAAAIHTALNRAALTIVGHTHLQTMRVARIPSFPETVDGVRYRRAGATYRIWTCPA